MIALGAAAFFVFSSERKLAVLRADGRDFDRHAREITASLSDLRSAQQAYVAAGQGVAFWMPKVGEIADGVTTATASLRSAATGAEIEDGVAIVQLGNGDGVAAPERGELCGVGQRVTVPALIQT